MELVQVLMQANNTSNTKHSNVMHVDKLSIFIAIAQIGPRTKKLSIQHAQVTPRTPVTPQG